MFDFQRSQATRQAMGKLINDLRGAGPTDLRPLFLGIEVLKKYQYTVGHELGIYAQPYAEPKEVTNRVPLASQSSKRPLSTRFELAGGSTLGGSFMTR